jgi:hypothetical protein
MEFMNMKLVNALLPTVFALAGSMTVAAAQTGPVSTACKDDIPKYCAGKKHGPPSDEVRVCLEANKDKVSTACKQALETAGGPRSSAQRNLPSSAGT